MLFDDKRKLCASYATLNGKSAVISGAKERFALVRQFPDGFISAEFSWETVARVVWTMGGKFHA